MTKRLNESQVILGDCLDELTKLESESIDLVVTDPPYFLPINSYVGTMENGYEKRTLEDASILKGYFKQIFIELRRITKKDGAWYIFCDGQSYPLFYDVIFPLCKNIRPLIWDKLTSVYGFTWRHQHELITFVNFDTSGNIPTGDGDVLKFRGVKQKDRNHPAEKPVELLTTLIKKHENAKTILDPYAGSGSVAMACKSLNKQCISIELNENYVEVMKKRLTQPIQKVFTY